MVFWVGDEMRSLFNLCNYVCLKIFLPHPVSPVATEGNSEFGAYACWPSCFSANGCMASRLRSVARLLTVVRCFSRATEIRIYIFAVHLAIASVENMKNFRYSCSSFASVVSFFFCSFFFSSFSLSIHDVIICFSWIHHECNAERWR